MRKGPSRSLRGESKGVYLRLFGTSDPAALAFIRVKNRRRKKLCWELWSHRLALEHIGLAGQGHRRQLGRGGTVEGSRVGRVTKRLRDYDR